MLMGGAMGPCRRDLQVLAEAIRSSGWTTSGNGSAMGDQHTGLLQGGARRRRGTSGD